MHCDQPMLPVNLWAKETILSAAAEVPVPNSQQRNLCWCHWYCGRLQEEAAGGGWKPLRAEAASSDTRLINHRTACSYLNVIWRRNMTFM